MSLEVAVRATVEEAQSALELDFRQPALLEQALTHRSLLQDMRQIQASNERLEFLGDSVLGQVVAEYLYRKHPRWAEGRLTKIKAAAVSEPTLAQAARRLGLGNLVRMSRGEEQSGGRDRDSLLSDALEAVIGALYLDRGMRGARTFVLRVLQDSIDRIEAQLQGKDYKTVLQEQIQEQTKTVPHYKVIEESGPDHAKMFVVQVLVNHQVLGCGSGRTKKAAEQAAARQALETSGGKA